MNRKHNISESELLKMAIKTAGIAYWQWNPKTNELKFDEDWFKKIEVMDDSSLDSWMNSLHPDDVEMVSTKIKDHLEGKSDFYEALMRLKSKTGEYKYVLAKGKIVERDENGVATNFSGVHVDLTEMMLLKKENEDNKNRMIQSSKLASLGEMAGGIAHEINTPLSTIRGYAEMLESLFKKEVNEKALKMAQKIINTTVKISELTGALRNLARIEIKENRHEFNISEALDEAILVTDGLVKKGNISLEKMILKDFSIFGSKNEMVQVFVNLIKNSIDSLNDKNLSKKWIKVFVSEDKNQKTFSVIDSGDGIPLAIRDKIMVPFFTTKPIGSGTGLGLSLSYEYIRSHNGELFYDDTSANTKFTVNFKK